MTRTRVIHLLMPAIEKQCERLGVKACLFYHGIFEIAHIDIVFLLEGVEDRIDCTIFESWANDDLYESINFRVEKICSDLRDSYFRMDC